MNLFEDIKSHVLAAIASAQEAGELPADLDLCRVAAEPPRDPAHGDASTNAAMVLAKQAKMPPARLADCIAARLRGLPIVTRVDVAPPGFINLRLADDLWRQQIRMILAASKDYGCADLGRGAAVNVEYCSANPTGPLHVGHGRGTVFGDALASLLAKMGWKVTREYYINDGGAQIDQLARSVHHRYLEALGCAPEAPPQDWYPGDYLIPVAEMIAQTDQDRWRKATEKEWLPPFRTYAVDAMMALIRADLEALGVRHDVFTSEAQMVSQGKVEEAFALLDQLGLAYEGTLPPPKGKPVEDWEPVPLLLFRSTRFGDDIDRPLRSSKGETTYFGKDLAYHLDKYRRGARELIDVLGADHGGYVKRMRAGIAALSQGEGSLDVKLCQLVHILDNGVPIRMSKRAGSFVTLRDLVDEVGKDVVRFIMLTRRNDAPLDFDLAKVTEQSRDNPVFYVQYAHARICSVRRHASAAGLATDRQALLDADLDLLTNEAELATIKLLSQYPRVLAAAAEHHEPHRIAFYLGDLAAIFHALWNHGNERSELRFLIAGEPALSKARLALISAVQEVIAAGLLLIGVDPLEEMT